MFELMILGFVLRDIHLHPQEGLKMQTKTCVFLHLTSTSSEAPPVVAMSSRLLR